MELFAHLFDRLPPLRSEKSPGLAAIIAFVFGVPGLGLYFRSLTDAVLLFGSLLFFVVFTGVEIAWLVSALLAGAYGFIRALHSNAALRHRSSSTGE